MVYCIPEFTNPTDPQPTQICLDLERLGTTCWTSEFFGTPLVTSGREKQMKAVLQKSFGGADVMYLGEQEDPVPGASQVLIRVVTTSVNRPDIVQREGNYPPPKGESDVLGLEVAGTIAAVGEGVTQWQEGDRVMGLVGGGAYAELALAWASHLMPVPDRLSWAEAACICETYITAHLNLFQFPGLENGQSVLLHGGGGGVNTAAIQLCQTLSPDSPLFVTASAKKTERVAALGATHVINYQSQDFAEVIKDLTKGRGVDVILDHIGAPYLASNLKCLAVNGTLVLIGVMGGVKSELNLAQLMVRRQKIAGSVLRPRPLAEKAQIIARFADDVLNLFKERQIIPLVDQVFPLEDVCKAHQMMESSDHFGKLVLQVDQTKDVQ